MRGAIIAIVSIFAFGLAAPAWAQAPTPEQQAAIKSNCRSDFMANCMGVPRGGKEAVQCLQKNLANLSAGCQQAIKAISAAAKPAAPAPAAPPTEPAPAAVPAPAPAAPAETAAPAPAPPAAATAPTTPPPSAPTATAPAEAAPAKAATPAPAAPAKKAVAAPPAAAAPPPPAAAAATPQVIVVAPRRIFALVRTACRAEYRAHCSNVEVGGGRVVACLQANAASLSPACRDGLAALAR